MRKMVHLTHMWNGLVHLKILSFSNTELKIHEKVYIVYGILSYENTCLVCAKVLRVNSSAVFVFQHIKFDVETKQPKFEEMKSQSSDFVKAGTHIMEPYRRLLERRWDNMLIKLRELEYALKTRKEEKDFVDAKPSRPRDDRVTVSKVTMVESAAPEYDGFWWTEEQEVKTTPGKSYVKDWWFA